MCNVCGRNLITGLTSATSPRVAISSKCKVGQKLRVSLPLLTSSPSAWPSRLLYRRGRKFRRDLWITLYMRILDLRHDISDVTKHQLITVNSNSSVILEFLRHTVKNTKFTNATPKKTFMSVPYLFFAYLDNRKIKGTLCLTWNSWFILFYNFFSTHLPLLPIISRGHRTSLVSDVTGSLFFFSSRFNQNFNMSKNFGEKIWF